jgi:hypothetical protein
MPDAHNSSQYIPLWETLERTGYTLRLSPDSYQVRVARPTLALYQYLRGYKINQTSLTGHPELIPGSLQYLYEALMRC